MAIPTRVATAKPRTSVQLLLQLGSQDSKQEAALAQIAAWGQCHRDEVGLIDDAYQSREPVTLKGNLLRRSRFQHLRRTLNCLNDNAHLSPHRLDVERGSLARVALNGDPFEIHEQPGDTTLCLFHRTLQRFSEHCRRVAKKLWEREFSRVGRPELSLPDNRQQLSAQRPSLEQPFRRTKGRKNLAAAARPRDAGGGRVYPGFEP
jgi:hypothetical protein